MIAVTGFRKVLLNQASGFGVEFALCVHVQTKLLGIHRIGARIYVHEIRVGSNLRNRLGCCNESERDRENDIPGLDANGGSERTSARRFRC